MKKVTALIIVLLLLFLCLTGCKDKPQPAPSSQTEGSGTVSSIQSGQRDMTGEELAMFENMLLTKNNGTYEPYAWITFLKTDAIQWTDFFYVLMDRGIVQQFDSYGDQKTYKIIQRLHGYEEFGSWNKPFLTISHDRLDAFTKDTLGQGIDSFGIEGKMYEDGAIVYNEQTGYSASSFEEFDYPCYPLGEVKAVLSGTVFDETVYSVYYRLSYNGTDVDGRMIFQKTPEEQYCVVTNTIISPDGFSFSKRMTESLSAPKKKESGWKMNVLKEEKTALTPSKENEENIRLFMRALEFSTSSSWNEKEMYFDSVRYYLSIPQLRSLPEEKEWSDGFDFYSVHDSLSGGRLFVFYADFSYDPENPPAYQAADCVFIKKSLHFKDFDGLKKGISTIKDVEAIDPATQFNFYDPEQRLVANIYVSCLKISDNIGTFYPLSGHLTKDGLVNILYRKVGQDFVVEDIQKDQSADYIEYLSYCALNRINEKDWP